MYGMMGSPGRSGGGGGNISPIIRNTSTPALEIQNTHASGDALSILDASGTQFVKIGRYSGGRSALSIGDISGVLNPSVMFWVNQNMDAHGSTFEASASTNGTNNIDIGASLFVSRMDNTGAVSHGRAIEGHHFRLPGASAGENYVMNLGRHCSVAHATPENDCGIRIDNEHTNWNPPISSGTTGGYGVLVQGEDPWTYAFGSRNSSNTRVWYVAGETGEVRSGNALPRASSTHTVGGSGLNWLVVTGDFITLTSNGAANAPALTNATFSTTGLFWNAGSADNLGITVASTEILRLGSSLVDFRTSQVASGTTGIVTLGNYGGTGRPASAGQAGWQKIKVAGVDAWIPYWQ